MGKSSSVPGEGTAARPPRWGKRAGGGGMPGELGEHNSFSLPRKASRQRVGGRLRAPKNASSFPTELCECVDASASELRRFCLRQ